MVGHLRTPLCLDEHRTFLNENIPEHFQQWDPDEHRAHTQKETSRQIRKGRLSAKITSGIYFGWINKLPKIMENPPGFGNAYCKVYKGYKHLKKLFCFLPSSQDSTGTLNAWNTQLAGTPLSNPLKHTQDLKMLKNSISTWWARSNNQSQIQANIIKQLSVSRLELLEATAHVLPLVIGINTFHPSWEKMLHKLVNLYYKALTVVNIVTAHTKNF